MKKLIRTIFCDIGSSALEAVLILFFIHVPLLLIIVWGMFTASMETSFLQHATNTISMQYTPNSAMTFISGILASSTVFFIINLKFIRIYPIKILFLIIAPIFIILFSSPLLFQDFSAGLANKEFASSYSLYLIAFALALWFVSLYQQRAIDRTSMDGAVQAIMKNVKAPE